MLRVSLMLLNAPSFVDISDSVNGVALLNTGLKAYEAADDEHNTMYLSLLRSFPLRICVTTDMQDYSSWDKGSQCIGKNTFRYAFMPSCNPAYRL